MVLSQGQQQPTTSSLYGCPAGSHAPQSSSTSPEAAFPPTVTGLAQSFGGSGGSLIPAGSLLYIHTPVIIPNLGITGAVANAIEVIYPPVPQPPAPQLPTQPFTVNCVHEAMRRTDVTIPRPRDFVNQKVQTPSAFSKQQPPQHYQHQEEMRMYEQPTRVLEQNKRDYPQMSLWQKLMQNGENVTDHSVR